MNDYSLGKIIIYLSFNIFIRNLFNNVQTNHAILNYKPMVKNLWHTFS